jgi:hypothetical protein
MVELVEQQSSLEAGSPRQLPGRGVRNGGVPIVGKVMQQHHGGPGLWLGGHEQSKQYSLEPVVRECSP